jgi:hypothetical protein
MFPHVVSNIFYTIVFLILFTTFQNKKMYAKFGSCRQPKVGAIITTSKKQRWLKGSSYVNKVVIVVMDSEISISEVNNFMIVLKNYF